MIARSCMVEREFQNHPSDLTAGTAFRRTRIEVSLFMQGLPSYRCAIFGSM